MKSFNIKTQSEEIEANLTQGGFKFVQRNLFYKEIKLTPKQKKKIEKITEKLELDKRRYFLAFNPELAYLTHKHRKERVEVFKQWIEEYNKELREALRDKKRETVEESVKNKLKKQKIANVHIGYVLEPYEVENKNKEGKKVTTYKVKLGDITEKSYEEAKQYDGLWILITNISKDEEFFNKTRFNSYFDIFRLKNNIEDSFKILSSIVEVEPYYVYRAEHIKAHFTICVLSYLLDITILNKIRNNDEIDNIAPIVDLKRRR